MTIYADSSFLVSFLYPGDLNHPVARRFFRLHAFDTWQTTAWSQFETINALRSLCLLSRGPSREIIEAIRRLFKHWHGSGPFLYQTVNWDKAIRDVNRLSAAFSAQVKARAADAVHIALLEQLKPDLFVTFDRDQKNLADHGGFPARLVR